MAWGKTILFVVGMTFALPAWLPAQEKPPECVVSYAPDGVTSLRKNAVVSIGGEVRVDYAYQKSETSAQSTQARSSEPPIDARGGDLSLRNTNLRIHADVHPNIQARMKLDFSSRDGHDDPDRVLEEALVVMQSVAGSGLSFFAGKGRAPYGQDITLGMIQSYNHVVNSADSSEGPILLNVPVRGTGSAAAKDLPPMRPGQFDRVFLAGAAYERDSTWRVEAAAFQPNDAAYEDRLAGWSDSDTGSDIGAAARIWWRPIEELTLQASGIVARSADMGRTGQRTDLDPGARGTKTAYSLSLGFDWIRGPWRVFGEYQRAWDWNFTKGYDVDVWQLGAARELGSGWRIGGMVETMGIDSESSAKVEDRYWKAAANVKYTFNSGFFVLAEYGHEWFRREKAGSMWEKRRGDFFGVRCGFSF